MSDEEQFSRQSIRDLERKAILREEIICAWIPLKPCDRAIGSDGGKFVPKAIKDSE